MKLLKVEPMDSRTKSENDKAKSIGFTIAKHRQARKLTQEYVAEKLNIGYEAVSRMERGIVIPTVERLIQLAEIFECQVSDLLTESSSRPTDQALHINNLLSKLNETDRILVVELVEKFVNRLAEDKA